MNEAKKILLLCTPGDSSAAIANALIARSGEIEIIEEEKEERVVFLRRRFKRLGLVAVVGQVLFAAVAAPFLRRAAAGRVDEIIRAAGFDLAWPPRSAKLTRVPSVNCDAAIELIARARPDIVVVNGTRIISRKAIAQFHCPAINVHCGITPKYRGCHGGYWALAVGDASSCGVTVHLIAEGVDTGDILEQKTISPGPSDNFVTYPYLQLAAAMPGLLEQVERGLANGLSPYKREGESIQWYHPTLWGYLWQGLRNSVW